MILFPAIDIKDGKCVRLRQGDFNQVEVFGQDPLQMAQKWQSQGAQYLHIVDLDGAKQGKGINRQVIKKIVQTLTIPVQLGGGIRSMEDVEILLSAGISRVILGTGALEDENFVEEALLRYEERIVVSLDAKDGYVALSGWTKVSDCKASDLAQKLYQKGLQTIVYTDIAKDGMMIGPNFAELAAMQKVFNGQIIASGGVTTVDDVKKLARMNLYGAIIGKALYVGTIDLPAALRISTEQ